MIQQENNGNFGQTNEVVVDQVTTEVVTDQYGDQIVETTVTETVVTE